MYIKGYLIGSLLCFYELLVFILFFDCYSMKKSIIIALLVSLAGFAQQKNIVLELFTSQGCSSCPRADQLLKEIAENSNNTNIIALAYHVDYWNRLGWKDPFSKASFTNYQQEYGRKFGGRSIYTPQLVINGTKHIVGSDKSSISSSLSTLKSKKLPVSISITKVEKEGTDIKLEYHSNLNSGNRLNIVMLLKKQITKVQRGENRNKTLLDTHIVIDKEIITTPELNSTIVFKNVNFNLEELEFVAYIQKENLEVVGATKWK